MAPSWPSLATIGLLACLHCSGALRSGSLQVGPEVPSGLQPATRLRVAATPVRLLGQRQNISQVPAGTVPQEWQPPSNQTQHPPSGAIPGGPLPPQGVSGTEYNRAPGSSGAPMVYFLFMVYDKINNQAVWDTFFAHGAHGSQYRVFVHCKDEAACKSRFLSSPVYELIPTVPTEYCTNLVNAMNTLLQAALNVQPTGHRQDKFVFVSGSTIPVKPFTLVHQRLTSDAGSDVCIFPRNEWAQVTENIVDATSMQSVRHVAVKHHQWVVLSRTHAAASVQHRVMMMDLLQRFQVNSGNGNSGCLDEFWHFATLFGTIKVSDLITSFPLPDFNGGPVSMLNPEIQGQCDTFVNWGVRARGSNNNMTQLIDAMISDPGSEIEPSTDVRPSTIRSLSMRSLSLLRSSWFLFARKVDDEAPFSGCGNLADAFNRHVFTSPPQLLPGEGQIWAGHGMWADTRGLPINIISDMGSLKVHGSSPDMQATGFFCGTDMTVKFVTGYTTRATLSPDQQELRFENGAVWRRSPSSSPQHTDVRAQ